MTDRRPRDPQASLTISGGWPQFNILSVSETLEGLGAKGAAGDDWVNAWQNKTSWHATASTKRSDSGVRGAQQWVWQRCLQGWRSLRSHLSCPCKHVFFCLSERWRNTYFPALGMEVTLGINKKYLQVSHGFTRIFLSTNWHELIQMVLLHVSPRISRIFSSTNKHESTRMFFLHVSRVSHGFIGTSTTEFIDGLVDWLFGFSY